MSAVRDRIAKERQRMATLGSWYTRYWKSLRYWRHELRKGNRTTTPHWPLPAFRAPTHWRRETFTHCACSKKGSWE